jgi:ketosteroid isomerase-like protein
MATQTAPLTKEQLAALPDSYFKAVDAQDVDAIVSHFADDATLIVQTDHAVFEGAAEIRRMFTDFCDNSVSIFHEIKNIVIEPAAGKVATEQSYIGELADGTKNDMHNCNFFDVNADGQFTRVIIWMAGTNPLK